MKANELMIGDWMQWYFDDEEYHPEKILRLDGNDIPCEPIPLTEEILKANGFELTESTYHLNIKGGLHLAIKKCRNDFKLKVVKSKTDNGEKGHTNSRRWRIPEIVYVHELQRALRCCKLWDLAYNFKITHN